MEGRVRMDLEGVGGYNVEVESWVGCYRKGLVG